MQRLVIVGAGVTGLSAAYHLAKQKDAQVTLIDKGPVGDGSSQRAAGIITGLLWSDAGVRVRKRCLELYDELSEDLPGYRFQRTGCLNLHNPASWADAERLLPLYKRLGVPYQILNPDEMRHRWPELHPAGDLIGLYDPRGGYSEPAEYLQALKQRVLELGVEIRERTTVRGFEFRHGRICGVKLADEIVECDAVIATVYSWTRALLSTVGLTLPVKCFVHQRYLTAPLANPMLIPAVNANPYGCYFRPAAGVRMLAGIETADRQEYAVETLDFNMTEVRAAAGLAENLRRQLSPLLPAVRSLAWESEKVGLLTFSMDGEPILGPIKEVPGLFVGLAFHSGGFAYNPGTGELLAELVSRGQTAIDVAAWSPDRFDPEETKAFLATPITQKDVARRRH